MRLRVRARKDGGVTVWMIPPLLAQFVRELPALLDSDRPEVATRRLFPDPSDDAEIAAEWRRAQHPELFALLADARSIVGSDIQSLGPARTGRSFHVRIAAGHVPAWISALNAARLTLGAVHDVTAADMDPYRAPTFDGRGLAILRIDLFAWLQGTLIEAVSPDA